MYKIIGADGKEYGPVPLDVMRQWLAQGRVNAQTKVQMEGATEWKLLSEFPEFGAGLAPSAPPSLGAAPGASSAAFEQVNGPAIGLMVVAILGFLAQATSLVWRLGFSALTASQAEGPFGGTSGPLAFLYSATFAVVSAILGTAVGILILLGAVKMKKLENYGLAMTASIIAMIPCFSPCCLLGLPLGIWAVVVLSKPEVKSAFH